MNEREKIIRLWFDMWIKKADLGIDNIFTDDVVYTESWSPKYENRKTVKHWFDEWNTRGSVLVWEIKQFFHQGNQTIVEWYFKSKMNNGNVEEFDGISLIVWTQDNKIKSLKELSDEVIMKLNDQLNMIRDNIGTEQEISITYFVPDDKKSGGAYLTHSGIVKKIDEFERKLIMQDETVIPTEQISVIQGEMFKGLYE